MLKYIKSGHAYIRDSFAIVIGLALNPYDWALDVEREPGVYKLIIGPLAVSVWY